jgi:hypothetical protein
MRRTRISSKTISVKVPGSLSAKLATIARKRRVSVSVVVREALERMDESNLGSFAERGSDFCGRLSGPSDLSSNADHLADYGR